MLKLGSTTINKILLGSTQINKVFLGSNQVYPMGSPPPFSISETFENAPLSGDISWTDVWSDGSVNGATITRSTSNPTQGTYTWRVQGTADGTNYLGFETADIYDLSSLTSISVDFYVQEIPNVGNFVISLYDGTDYYEEDTTALGATTLTINIAAASGSVDVSNVTISFYAFGIANDADFYVDNLISS